MDEKKSYCTSCWKERKVLNHPDGTIEIKCGCGSQIFKISVPEYIKIEKKGSD